MKTFVHNTLFVKIFVIVASCLAFVACKKNDSNDIVDNNLGVEINLRNNNEKLALSYIPHAFYVGYPNEYWYSSTAYICINRNNNFRVEEDFGLVTCSIVCVGNVSKLGEISSIPESGWVSELAVQPYKGYIVKHSVGKSAHYTRIYVANWLVDINGGIAGATIRYDVDWIVE